MPAPEAQRPRPRMLSTLRRSPVSWSPLSVLRAVARSAYPNCGFRVPRVLLFNSCSTAWTGFRRKRLNSPMLKYKRY
eukprot:6371893-Alexandrium_andersonii.AAC.1